MVPLFVLLLFAGCRGAAESTDAPARPGADASEADVPEAAMLRLQNDSDLDFSSATVRFPGAEERFGAIAAGAASTYRAFETAYRYGSITVEAGGETYEVRAIDYVSEEPLEAGRYTYRLDIADGGLQMAFERD